MNKPSSNTNPGLNLTIAGLRLGLGWIFIWAFLDKLWGLGFSTCRDAITDTVTIQCSSAWVSGGSPTTGFLQFATTGPFAEVFSSLAGAGWADWLFMVGLLLIGLALALGIGIKIAVVSGSLLMILMWLATLQPANNPIIDDHIIYALVLLIIGLANDSQRFGLGRWWKNRSIVKKYPILR